MKHQIFNKHLQNELMNFFFLLATPCNVQDLSSPSETEKC